MTARRARLLCLVLLAGGWSCSGDGGASAPAPITQFSYRATWGPCPPDLGPCLEELVATPDGALTYTERTNTRSSALTPGDASGFRRFLDDPELTAAISDTAPCPAISDTWQTVTLARGDDQTPLVKDVAGCQGATYDAINAWLVRARAYFPQ